MSKQYYNNQRNNLQENSKDNNVNFTHLYYIFVNIFLMNLKFLINHLAGRDLAQILCSEDAGDIDKAEVKWDFALRPLEMGSLKVEGFVEISGVVNELLRY